MEYFEILYSCKISSHSLTIRELAKLIRNLITSMEAVPYGRLFYRQLEKVKIKLNLLNRTKVI